ncbi:uncharacterized protein EDB91DRAFT_1280678 [Suillus paluster]|uniref:uncharacterized protein n=1 Tax=Suillus paluster TaxID=48578 RepID=UPI001B87B25C|nr:uncharacterized protein EDB91DRAFT_1280678 [Suillus paluster]KAG1741413.1 hypothetical protein EDB91DRAFT_1280678 [Suillus paluster]
MFLCSYRGMSSWAPSVNRSINNLGCQPCQKNNKQIARCRGPTGRLLMRSPCNYSTGRVYLVLVNLLTARFGKHSKYILDTGGFFVAVIERSHASVAVEGDAELMSRKPKRLSLTLAITQIEKLYRGAAPPAKYFILGYANVRQSENGSSRPLVSDTPSRQMCLLPPKKVTLKGETKLSDSSFKEMLYNFLGPNDLTPVISCMFAFHIIAVVVEL